MSIKARLSRLLKRLEGGPVVILFVDEPPGITPEIEARLIEEALATHKGPGPVFLSWPPELPRLQEGEEE